MVRAVVPGSVQDTHIHRLDTPPTALSLSSFILLATADLFSICILVSTTLDVSLGNETQLGFHHQSQGSVGD